MSRNKNLQKQIFVIAMLLFLILPMQAFSQSGNAQLSGTVKDPSGGIIQGAAVTLIRMDPLGETKATTNNAGFYSFPGLAPGEYTLAIKHPGFNEFKVENITLETQQSAVINAKMNIIKAPDVIDIIDVKLDRDIILTTEPSTGVVLDSATIERLPTTTNNVMDLINFIPGVVPPTYRGASPNGVANPNNIMLGGTRGPGVAVIRDGINVNEVRWGSGIATPSQMNPELVKEMKVILSPADAEYGRGVAQVQLITKTGGDNFHGSLVYNVQNSALNPTNYNPFLPNNFTSQHNYNVTLSGPIIKKKTFFFLNWDQTIANNRTDVTPIVLTNCARKGIMRYFSGVDNANASGAGTNSLGANASFSGTARASVTTAGIPLARGLVPDDQALGTLTTTYPPPSYTAVTVNGAPWKDLQFVSAFGRLNSDALDLLNKDPINCSAYDPYSSNSTLPFGVSTATSWDAAGTTNLSMRQLTTKTVPQFSALMPLPNDFGMGYGGGVNYQYGAGNNMVVGGDGLNTAVYRWTRKNQGVAQNAYASGNQNNRANINLNVNHNYSELTHMSLNFMTELTSGVNSTKAWPDTGYDGKAKRTPIQIGYTVNSTIGSSMFNEARIGLARTVAHVYSPMDTPDNGDKVKQMLLSLVDTRGWTGYDGQPLIVGLGAASEPQNSTTYGTMGRYQYPPAVSFSPEASGASVAVNSFRGSSNVMGSHPYGSASNGILPTYGGSDNRWTITDTFTWMKDTHSIKVGGDIRLTRSYQDSNGPTNDSQGLGNNALTYPIAYGGFTDYSVPNWTYPTTIGLTGTLTYGLKTGGGTIDSTTGTTRTLADLLTYMSGSLGSIRQMYIVNKSDQLINKRWNDLSKGEFTQITDMRQKEFSFFAKDDWRVNPALTLNLGVRWEYYGIPWSANGLTVGLQGGPEAMFGITGRGFQDWLPTIPQNRGDSYLTAEAFIGPNSPSPQQRLFKQDFNNFGPAIGFSYRVPGLGKGATIMRGGYQLSYQSIGNMGSGFGSSLANVGGMTYSHYYRGESSPDRQYISVDNLSNFIPTSKVMDPNIVPMSTMRVKDHSVPFFAYDYNTVSPYSQSLNLSLTRNITNNIALDIRYTGTLARKGIGGINLNSPNVFNNKELYQALSDARYYIDPFCDGRGLTAAQYITCASTYDAARVTAKAPSLLDKMFYGIEIPQAGSAPATQKIGVVGSFTGADVIRHKYSAALSNGDYASIGESLADLNYDKTATGYNTAGVQVVTNTYNANLDTVAVGEHGAVLRNANTTVGGPGYGMFPENYILTNPQMSTAEYRGNMVHSNYHALQVQVLLRPTKGMSLTSAYTFAKNMADEPVTGNFWGGGGAAWTDPRNRELDYRPSLTRKHQLSAYGYMDLPFGQNGYFFRNVKNEILSRAIEGWQLSWTLRLQSGVPQQVSGSDPHLYGGGYLMDMSDYVIGCYGPDGARVTGGCGADYGGVEHYDLLPGNSKLIKTPVSAGGTTAAWNQQYNYYGYGYGGGLQKYVEYQDPQCRTLDNTHSIATAQFSSVTYMRDACKLMALYVPVFDGTGSVATTNGSNGADLTKPILVNPLPGKIGTFSKYVEGVGTVSLNMSLGKELKLTEGKAVVFRIDGTNILNLKGVTEPSLRLHDTYGTPFGQAYQVLGDRQIQARMNLKY